MYQHRNYPFQHQNQNLLMILTCSILCTSIQTCNLCYSLLRCCDHLLLLHQLVQTLKLTSMSLVQQIATLDLRVDYHRPAVAGADLYALAQVERVTRQVVFVSGRVWQGEDPDKATAVARASFMRAANAQRPVAREAGE